MSSEAPVVARMQSLVSQWQEAANPQAVFLSCYMMMTGNTLAAIEGQEFADPAWVGRLLDRFAEYYFVALESYERDRAAAPPVWQLAHDATRDPDALPVQNLLLGVNAHINYDLVLTLDDLLRPDWPGMSHDQRATCFDDYCHVNDIIGRTIDDVQDQVLEPAMPAMDIVDKLLGPLDERLISALITGWRETVWENAASLLEAKDEGERLALLQGVEEDALNLGKKIGFGVSRPPGR